MSEFLELVKASGFELEIDGIPFHAGHEKIDLVHREGFIFDTIEQLDGLANLAVVVYGMAVEMGQNLDPIVREVVAASVTKLNPRTGKIDKNRCQRATDQFNGYECHESSHRQLPHEPVGKWIKGVNYTPPQIGAIIDLPTEY